jgi:hypothetical protein
MACNSECNKCNKCTEWCTCKTTKILGECDSEISAKCIIYKPEGGISSIDKYIGFGTKRNYQDILERLDSKLYTLTSVQVSECAKTLLGLPTVSELSIVINKVADYLCNLSDTKVKINSSDTYGGYLYDKITLGECIVKTVVTDNVGNKTLKLSLDYDCVIEKTTNVTWADVSPSETVCTGNDLYKKQISTGDNFRWVLQEANYSSCIQCTPSWVDVSPIERSCTSIGEYSLQLFKKQEDGCGNIRYVKDDIFTWDSSSVDCTGESSVAQLQVTPNIATEFAINDGNTLVWLTNGTNTYNISGLPKTGGLKNFKARPVGLTCVIGGILQMCTGLTNCEETSWTNTDTTRCNAEVSQIQQISNCGTTRWVSGGDACNTCNDPIPLISISADDNTICGSQVATLTASHNGCNSVTWFKRVTGGTDIQIGTGNSTEVTANATVYAKCVNCQGIVYSTNDIEIVYTAACTATCSDPVFTLSKSCNTNPVDANVWKTGVTMSNINSGNKYAVYPNTDGTGVVPNYANASPISASSIILKQGVNVGEVVKVKVYNGSDNCFTHQLVNVVSADCLDSCSQVASVTVQTNNATPKVSESVVYTATPNGGASAPFTYQWKLDGVAISGATLSNFYKTWSVGDVGARVVTVDVGNCLANGTSTGTINVTVKANITAVTGSGNC